MGRYTGHIALEDGLAGGADVILIPEKPFEVEEVCEYIRRREVQETLALLWLLRAPNPKVKRK